MPKKIKLESFKYHFLLNASKKKFYPCEQQQETWNTFLKNLFFNYQSGECIISHKYFKDKFLKINLKEYTHCLRGDELELNKNFSKDLLYKKNDPIKKSNEIFILEKVLDLSKVFNYKENDMNKDKYNKEKIFHDEWAKTADLNAIDIKKSNEVCTAPEMRYITKKLGNIDNKSLLDIGCGLGEASIYFAYLGADVTSSDLSPGMLEATSKLASLNHLKVKTHLSSAEDLMLDKRKFDIIYAGNLLHHVNIEETIERIKFHVKDDGVFVSWDPIHYNPLINIYRKIAKDVRTPDEHPLKYKDIKTIKKNFNEVETKFFWLFTLIIFIIMAIFQGKNPNKERFWKVVVNDGEKWEWLYKPLEILDQIVLTLIPPLKWLCWNVVIIAKKPKI